MSHMTFVMLGGGGVGKSAITVQLVSGVFVQMYNPTIEDSFNTTIKVDDEMVSLNIVDTAGQEEYSSLRDQYMRSGDGFVIVYSITSTNSFLDVSGIRDQLYRVLEKDENEHICMVLCGNKCDMESDRQVNAVEVKEIAEEWQCPFFETSAKSRINILESFQALVKDVKDWRMKLEALENEKLGQQEKKKESKRLQLYSIG
ncbi:small monomeric GTPase [Entamoeba marina]